ncbi:MAG: amylo-alpha-1,6-glucosidase [Deltaproteobacteria bacterium]|nr:amylo-alpha-1,6-glucosidase [Deltaproteobacteria bacterium]
MGTADGVRTRRYHALLVAATRPPEGRMVLVADLEVEVETAAGQFALSSHRYRGEVVWPDGIGRLVGFSAAPWPRWEYALADGTRIAAECVIAPGAARVHLRWRKLAGGAAHLLVRPLCAGRDHHALHHENPAFRFDADDRDGRVTWRPYDGVPAITAAHNGRYVHAPDWYRGFRYDEEAARGLDAEEDLATPGTFAFDLASDAVLVFAAGGEGGAASGGDVAIAVAHVFDDERARRAGFASAGARAADSYLVARGDGRSVIAGYPWFTDWGRDTFISLRGLCLATGRLDDARAIVRAWCAVLSDGMLPNRFVDDGGAPEYNSVDASLWFVIAADALVVTGACLAAEVRAIDEAIAAIVAGYQRGCRHGIRVDVDGLVASGEPGVQLTWMDAKVGDWVVTPRTGKPVEIQALWVNALAIAARRDASLEAALARARVAFASRFWNPARAMLFDVVDCDHVAGVTDDRLRPNQILAVGGLPLPVCNPAGSQARAIVDAVERALWTPMGLRSLAPGEPAYHRGYFGGPRERDGAYHQGTVWTWLAGPFIEAWVRVRGDTIAARREARTRFLDPLLSQLATGASCGHLGELADGDPPHAAKGCPFQAWSVAEVLRVDALLR